MPANTVKECVDIKSIYTSSWYHTTLWAYISGQTRRGASTSQAIDDFINFFQLEDAEKSSIWKAYNRRNKEFRLQSGTVKTDVKKAIGAEKAIENEGLRDQLKILKATLIQQIDQLEL